MARARRVRRALGGADRGALPGLGGQRVPVAVYALLLTATAIASRWHSPRSGLGGTLFFISDTLIALRMAGRDFPGRGALVMSSYAIGQYLLTSGITASRPDLTGSGHRR